MSCSAFDISILLNSISFLNTLTSTPLYKIPQTFLYFLFTIPIFFLSSFSHFNDEISSFSDFVSKIIAGNVRSSGKYQPSGLSIIPLNPSWLKVVICPVPCFTLASTLSKPSNILALSLTSSSVRYIFLFTIDFPSIFFLLP